MPNDVFEHAASDWTERLEILKALRSGTVPRDGLERLAVLEPALDAELTRMVDDATTISGAARFVRGDYGSGKTFCCQLIAARARAAGFATSVITLDRTLTTLANPLALYRAMVGELRVPHQAGQGLRSLVDAWLVNLESANVAGEADLSLAARVARSLEHDGVREASPMVAAALSAAQGKLEVGAFADAFALLEWVSGSDNVAYNVPRDAGLAGRLRADDVENAIGAVVALVRAAGLKGLVVVFDEVATTLMLERKAREQSWGQVARIVDVWTAWPRTLWVFAVTSEVVDHHRGMLSNAGLHQRVALQEQDGIRSLRQPQLVLEPMNEDRLRRVARRVVDLYPADDVTRLRDACTDDVIAGLVARVAAGFSGHTQMIPRAFLRAFVNLLDAFDSGHLTSFAGATAELDPADLVEAAGPVMPAEEEPVVGAPVSVVF